MDIIYTPYPIDMVLEGKDNNDQYNFQNINYQGIDMQVMPLGWNKFKIIRLYSTDPQHYLNNELQPGSIISF
jgi:hypothetical protein